MIVFSIYAIGDCIHGPMLAHKAEDEGEHEFSNVSSSSDSIILLLWSHTVVMNSDSELACVAGDARKKGATGRAGET